eukprot:650816-Pyramimonas_sp.AAC.1
MCGAQTTGDGGLVTGRIRMVMHCSLLQRTAVRMHGTQNWWLAAWRQVFVEVGGIIPDRNVE